MCSEFFSDHNAFVKTSPLSITASIGVVSSEDRVVPHQCTLAPIFLDLTVMSIHG